MESLSYLVLGAVVGFVLYSGGITIVTWQFWAIMLILVLSAGVYDSTRSEYD